MTNTDHVLFVAYGGGHIAKAAPVVKVLQERGISCTVLALTVGYKKALQLDLTPCGYHDFLHLVDAATVLARGASLLDGNRHPEVDDLESRCYLGINYQEWVDAYGEEEAARLYAERGRRGFLPVKFFGKILDYLQPDVVVSTSSPRSEQAAIEAAVQRGIPSLTMMDLFALSYDPFLRLTVHADRITVMSDYVKKNLVDAGIDAQRVVVTGCPAYDPLFDPLYRAQAREFLHKQGWQGKKVVLWAGYLEEDGPGVLPEYLGTGFGLEVERRLRAWVREDPSAALIVRYHPNQYHEFPDLGPQERVYLSASARESAFPLLHAADTVIVQTSTIGLEGALIGKCVLNLQYAPSVVNLGFDYSELGLGEAVTSMEQLVPMVQSPRSRLTEKKILPPTGLAAPRVAEQIELLLKTRYELNSYQSRFNGN